jgi:DNA-binding NarL/FixJ family response regulator
VPAETGIAGPIRVFLVDDHRVVRSGVSAYLAQVDDIEVIGEAREGRQALDRIASLEPGGNLPDVVLMDLMMPVMDGITATRQIRSRWPAIEVVVMTSFAEEAKVRGALEAGAAGYLLKDADADQVAQAIRAALAGRMHLDPVVARLLADSLRAPRRPAGSLTPGSGRCSRWWPGGLEPSDRPDPGGERAHRPHARVGDPGQAGAGLPDPGRPVGGTGGPGARARRPLLREYPGPPGRASIGRMSWPRAVIWPMPPAGGRATLSR